MTVVNRLPFYLQRGQNTRYLGKNVTVYPGSPTVPNSFTGNLVLQAGGNGVGAKLLSGVQPTPVIPLPCNEIEFLTVPYTSYDAGDGETLLTISYSDADPATDSYRVFLPSTASQVPILNAVLSGVDQVDLTLNIAEGLLGGGYSLRVQRNSDPVNCFAVKSNAFEVIETAACTLTITDMTGDGIDPNPFIFPGTLDNVISVTGSGFLSGTISATIFQVSGAPPGTDLNIDSVTVFDDNSLDIQFDTFVDSFGDYGLTLSVDEIPGCEATIGLVFGEPTILIVSI
jgi:hypothetical protein